MSVREVHVIVFTSLALFCASVNATAPQPPAQTACRVVQSASDAAEIDKKVVFFNQIMLKAQIAALRGGSTIDSDGRLLLVVYKGETYQFSYQGDRLSAIKMGQRSLSVGYAPVVGELGKGSLIVRSDDGALLGTAPLSGASHAQSLAPARDAVTNRLISAEEAGKESASDAVKEANAFSRQKVGKACTDAVACDAFRDYEYQSFDSDFDREIALADAIQDGAGGIPVAQQVAATWAYGIRTAAIDRKRARRKNALIGWGNCAFGC
jgi:hypothetical protein